MQNEKRLFDLCADLLSAKADENLANERRVAIEREIIAITGLPDEGVSTTTTGEYKIKVEQKINRKIDPKAYALIVDQIPDAVRPVRVVEELKVETAGVRWLKDNEPGYYKLLCQAMTETPAKPSVKIEVAR
jgi:hypothetical protein